MNEIGQPTWENQPTLDELRQQHPQVTEKAIVDYVNSLEVLEDHLRLRDTSHNCFLTRIWDSITGKTAQRQQIIDRNLTTALQTVSVWLQDLQLCQAESELAMAHMADKLIETRAGVMRLQQRHKILVAEVQDLNQRFEQFQNRVNHQLTQLEAQIQQMEAARLANVHLEQVFNKWQAGRFDNYPPLARLYLVIDELHWGHFGAYCRRQPETNEVHQLREQLVNKALIQMKQDLGQKTHQLMLMEHWLSPIQTLPDESRREILAYLSDWTHPQTTPITWTINNAALSDHYFFKINNQIPRVLSAQQAINHLIDENEQRL